MSLSELFWAGQRVYLEEVFPPILLGVAVFFILLIALIVFGFLRRYRLWKLGQPDDRSGNWWKRFLTTLAVAVANFRIIRERLSPQHILLISGGCLA